MAIRYVDSNATGGTGTGLTEANAYLTYAAFTAADVAGDVCYVSSLHNELTGGVATWTLAGTLALPVLTLDGVFASGEPPVTRAVTAVFGTGGITGSCAMTLSGVGYVYGIKFRNGSGSTSTISHITLAGLTNNYQAFLDCEFYLLSSGGACKIILGASNAGICARVVWRRCSVSFASTGQQINPLQAQFMWTGGGLLAGSASPTILVVAGIDSMDYQLDGLDLSLANAAIQVFSSVSGSTGKAVIRNSKMPAAWNGVLGPTPVSITVRYEMYNVDSIDTNYRCSLQSYTGAVDTDASIYRSPGLGVTSWMYAGAVQVLGLSHRYVGSGNAEFLIMPLIGFELSALNEVVSPAVGHTVEFYFTTGHVTALTNQDIIIQLQYQGIDGSPQSFTVTERGSVVGTPVTHLTDAAGNWSAGVPAWQATTAYGGSGGITIRPTVGNTFTYSVASAGTSGSTEPVWPTTQGAAVADGTIVWRCMWKQKIVVLLDGAPNPKIAERGYLTVTPFVYLAVAFVWIDPMVSLTST